MQPKIQTVRVVLLDADRRPAKELQLDERQFGFRITVDGVRYDHVDTRPDGVWCFARMT